MYEKPLLSEYYRKKKKEITSEIKSQTDSYLLSVNPEEYVDYLVQKHGLPEIIFDEDKELEIEKVRRSQKVRDPFDKMVEQEYLNVKLAIPVKPYERISEVLGLLPKVSSSPQPDMNYEHGYIITEVAASDIQVEKRINVIKQEVSRRNTEISEWNQELRRLAGEGLSHRRSQIENEQTLLETIVKKVSVPLKQKVAVTSVIPTTVKYSEAIKPVAPPKAVPPTELVLEEDKFHAILNLVDNSCRQFESTPQTFAKLEEEELRNVILSNLNSVFEGEAVGEAFSKKGKTDIYLKVNKGGIFIAECKYWSGPKTVDEAVDQILGYLTWRNSYGTVVLFAKRKNFTSVLETIVSRIPQLSSYVKGLKKVDASHFRALHHLPEDNEKLVEIHYMLYNLYFLD